MQLLLSHGADIETTDDEVSKAAQSCTLHFALTRIICSHAKLDIHVGMNSSKSSHMHPALLLQSATAILPFAPRYVYHAISELRKKLELCLAQVTETSSMQVQPDIQPETDTTKMKQLRKGWSQQQQEVQTIDKLHQDFIHAEKEICTQKLLHLQRVQACQKALAMAEPRSDSF